MAPPPLPPPRRHAATAVQPFSDAQWRAHQSWRRYLPHPWSLGMAALRLSPIWGWAVAVAAAVGLYATYAEPAGAPTITGHGSDLIIPFNLATFALSLLMMFRTNSRWGAGAHAGQGLLLLAAGLVWLAGGWWPALAGGAGRSALAGCAVAGWWAAPQPLRSTESGPTPTRRAPHRRREPSPIAVMRAGGRRAASGARPAASPPTSCAWWGAESLGRVAAPGGCMPAAGGQAPAGLRCRVCRPRQRAPAPAALH